MYSFLVRALHSLLFLTYLLIIGVTGAQDGAPIPGELTCDIPGYDQLPELSPDSDLPCGWMYKDPMKSVADKTVTDPTSNLLGGGAYIRVAAQAYWGAIGGKAWSVFTDFSAANALSSWRKDQWLSAGDTYVELTVQGKGEGNILITDTLGEGHIFGHVSLESNLFNSPCEPEAKYVGILQQNASSSSAGSGSVSVPIASTGASLIIPQVTGTGDHPARPYDWSVTTHNCCTDNVVIKPQGTLSGRVFANASLFGLPGSSVTLRYDTWYVLLLECQCP